MICYNKFLEEYGDKTFAEIPFCDVDNVALCNIFYMPLDKVIPAGIDSEPMDFPKAAYKMYAYNGFRHKAPGLVLIKNISVQLLAVASCKRYKEVKVVNCTETFEREPAVQFGAITLLLPDGRTAVIYRGTDDTLVGWKEDLDMYTRKSIPSFKLAVDYLEATAKKYDGDIIVCGHSKGGNVALAAGLFCSEETRARIKLLYNNDGPGFSDYDYLESDAYKELLPKYRHFVPQSSLVGMLLAHDYDYTVIKSTRLLGPLEHDACSWVTNGTTLRTCADLTKLGKITDVAFHNIIFEASDEQNKALDTVIGDVIDATGCRGLLDVAHNLPSAVSGAVKAWKNEDESTKENFKATIKSSGKYVTNAFRDVVLAGLEPEDIILGKKD